MTLPIVDVAAEVAHAGTLIGMMVGALDPDQNGPPPTLAAYLHALHRRDQSIRAWEQFFERWDGLLGPAAMVTAFPHCEPGAPLHVDDQRVAYGMVSAHSTVFNYTGHPAVVFPYTLDRHGLPIGVQVVGKRWGESQLLALAKAIVPTTDGFRRPPRCA